jgi:hypothetical protein
VRRRYSCGWNTTIEQLEPRESHPDVGDAERPAVGRSARVVVCWAHGAAMDERGDVWTPSAGHRCAGLDVTGGQGFVNAGARHGGGQTLI